MRGGPSPAPSEQADPPGNQLSLKERAVALQAELDRIKSRLSEIDTARGQD
jgi:hypothetical protein